MFEGKQLSILVHVVSGAAICNRISWESLGVLWGFSTSPQPSPRCGAAQVARVTASEDAPAAAPVGASVGALVAAPVAAFDVRCAVVPLV